MPTSIPVMIWNKLNEGIQFENSEIFIPWNASVNKIKSIGTPVIKENGGHIDITWPNTSLLKGVVGDWTISSYSHESLDQFKSIGLLYLGDKVAIEAYNKLRDHLLKIFGNPSFSDEGDNRDKTIKWENDSVYVYLYLFEMHAYRCNLGIGKK